MKLKKAALGHNAGLKMQNAAVELKKEVVELIKKHFFFRNDLSSYETEVSSTKIDI